MSNEITRRRLISRGDIPGSNGGIYNPGALADGDHILLLCRREIDYRFCNELVFPELLTLDRRTLDLLDSRTLSKVGFPLDTRIEDFRALAFGGLRLVAHSTVRPDRIRPAISRMHADALQAWDAFELPVPEVRVEKNWVLFEHQQTLHCLYKLDPLTIFALGPDHRWQLVKEQDNGWALQFDRVLSNSTNLIPFEGGYLGFWHSIVHDRYVQGAFLLDDTLSVRYRTGVLLDGADFTDGFKPGVIYISGLVDDGERILAFYGEGDAHTGVALFNRAELAAELRRSPFVAVDAIHVGFAGQTLSDAMRGMQALRDFSERRRHPRIRLYVAQEALRETLGRLALPNVIVQPASPGERLDCTLVGTSGSLHWG